MYHQHWNVVHQLDLIKEPCIGIISTVDNRSTSIIETLMLFCDVSKCLSDMIKLKLFKNYSLIKTIETMNNEYDEKIVIVYKKKRKRDEMESTNTESPQ